MLDYVDLSLAEVRKIDKSYHEDDDAVIDFLKDNNLLVVEISDSADGYFGYAIYDKELGMYYCNNLKEPFLSKKAIRYSIIGLLQVLDLDSEFFLTCNSKEKISKFLGETPLYVIVRIVHDFCIENNNIVGIYPTKELAHNVFIKRANNMSDKEICTYDEACEFWDNYYFDNLDYPKELFYEKIEETSMQTR